MAATPSNRAQVARDDAWPQNVGPCTYCREHGTLRNVSERLARCEACAHLVPLPRRGSRDSAAPAPPITAPFPLGSTLRDRYRLVELIGCGAHGLTYLAHHEFLNHPCVVKVLPHRVADASDRDVHRLRREASAGFRVNHANVVRVLDGDIFENIWYFVMDFIDGVDLARARECAGVIDWRQVTQFAVDAASGLEAIHRAGLIHRDIKPSNLILGVDGALRIADLGVVGLMPEADDATPQGASDRVGTLAYAAPEVLAGEEPAGPPADLYALGATLFELVTGTAPRGDSVYRTLLNGGDQAITWPESGAQDAPDWLRNAILRLLAQDPRERFPSPAALVDYLENPSRPGTQVAPAGAPVFPEPRGVVVLPFENASRTDGDDWIGQALADHLARSLGQYEGTYVVDVNQYLQTLERVRARESGPHVAQLLHAGRLSGAASVVEGVFERSGDTIKLSVRAHQAPQTEPMRVEAVTGALSALADLESELLGRLTRRLGLATASRAAVAGTAATRIPAAEEQFFTGKRAFLRGDYETAMKLGLEAIRLDANFGEAVGFVGVCCARMGRYADAVEYNRRQRELAARAGDERLKIEAHANLGSMYYFQGDYESANSCLERAAQASETLGLSAELARIRNNLGYVLLQLGRATDAERSYQQAIDTHKRNGALISLIGPYTGVGHVLREQKRFEEARGYFRRALALAQESDDRVNEGVAYMNLGNCAMLMGRLLDAKNELAVALNILVHTKFWNGLARVYDHMAELNLKLSNFNEAVRCADQRIELARRHSNAPMEEAARRQKSEAMQRLVSSGAARVPRPPVREGGSDA